MGGFYWVGGEWTLYLFELLYRNYIGIAFGTVSGVSIARGIINFFVFLVGDRLANFFINRDGRLFYVNVVVDVSE